MEAVLDAVVAIVVGLVAIVMLAKLMSLAVASLTAAVPSLFILWLIAIILKRLIRSLLK